MMQAECPQCGKKFKRKYPKQIFCSAPCYWRAKKELKEIVCLGCGIHFTPTTAKTYFHTRQCFLQHRRKPEVIAERFWSYVIKTETCWNWTGDTSESGYGVHSFRTTRTHHVRAHRWSWEHHNGPIPDGLCVLHKCDNRACVRPEHLFLGTRTDNAMDRDRKGRQFKGEQCHNAKVTAEVVVSIRELYATGHYSQRALADKFGIGQQATCSIVNRETWKHV